MIDTTQIDTNKMMVFRDGSGGRATMVVSSRMTQHRMKRSEEGPLKGDLDKGLCLVTQSCLTHCDPMDCSPPGSSVYEDSPCKNIGVGCHAPLQGLNPGLPHCRQILYHLSHQGSPRILEWVAYLFFRGAS